MLTLVFCGGIILLCVWYGAKAGLGSVARQIIASSLALGLATYLAPLIATALKMWLPFALVWFIASLVVFFFVAITAHKTLTMFSQGMSLPKWLSISGGGVLMGGVGALGVGLILWTIQFSQSITRMTLSDTVARAEGVYHWASVEIEVLTRWSLLASGIEQPMATSLGKFGAEPGYYLQQVTSLALSPELKVFWEDTQAHELMQQENDEALVKLLSGQLLLQQPAAVNLLGAMPYDGVAGNMQLMKQVRQAWTVHKRLLDDAEIKTLLADGSLVAQVSRRDLLSLYLNPHWRPLLERIQIVLSQPAPIPTPNSIFPEKATAPTIPIPTQ